MTEDRKDVKTHLKDAAPEVLLSGALSSITSAFQNKRDLKKVINEELENQIHTGRRFRPIHEVLDTVPNSVDDIKKAISDISPDFKAIYHERDKMVELIPNKDYILKDFPVKPDDVNIKFVMNNPELRNKVMKSSLSGAAFGGAWYGGTELYKKMKERQMHERVASVLEDTIRERMEKQSIQQVVSETMKRNKA